MCPSSTHIVQAFLRVLPPLLRETEELEVGKHESWPRELQQPHFSSSPLWAPPLACPLPWLLQPGLGTRGPSQLGWPLHTAFASLQGFLSPALPRAELGTSADGLSVPLQIYCHMSQAYKWDLGLKMKGAEYPTRAGPATALSRSY